MRVASHSGRRRGGRLLPLAAAGSAALLALPPLPTGKTTTFSFFAAAQTTTDPQTTEVPELVPLVPELELGDEPQEMYAPVEMAERGDVAPVPEEVVEPEEMPPPITKFTWLAELPVADDTTTSPEEGGAGGEGGGTCCTSNEECIADIESTNAKGCGDAWCDEFTKMCAFNAWINAGINKEKCINEVYVGCDRDDSMCNKGPFGDNGLCIGSDSTTCVYLWCPMVTAVTAVTEVQEQEAQEQQTLIDNKDKWSNNGPPLNYEFTFQRACSCNATYLGPFDVQVANGEVVVVTFAIDGIEGEPDKEVPTVVEMFDMIQTAIDENYYELDVIYNDVYGFPEVADFDPSEPTADDGKGITVTNFVVLQE